MNNEPIIATIAIAILTLVIGSIAYTINYVSCIERWDGTFKTDFGIFQGCRIEIAPGKWIPEDRYREVEQ